MYYTTMTLWHVIAHTLHTWIWSSLGSGSARGDTSRAMGIPAVVARSPVWGIWHMVDRMYLDQWCNWVAFTWMGEMGSSTSHICITFTHIHTWGSQSPDP